MISYPQNLLILTHRPDNPIQFLGKYLLDNADKGTGTGAGAEKKKAGMKK
jgi:hypothetical protein